MRHFIALVAVWTLASAPVVLAAEPSSPPPRSPNELSAAVYREIDLVSGIRRMPLPPRDRVAYMGHRLARLDLFVGSIREEAHDTLMAEVADPAIVSAIWGLGGDSTRNDIATALAATRFPTVAEEQFALDWVNLYAAIDELRSVTRDQAPDRVCPVAGPVSFTDDFGDPRPYGRSHSGIDLNGALGTPLVAMERGTVVQANWHWAGGRQVWIRADVTGDVYYYAHLDSWASWIWTGTRVKAGDVIGTLGWSGDAESAHLHFGWMPGSNDVDLENLQDAYPLLSELCR